MNRTEKKENIRAHHQRQEEYELCYENFVSIINMPTHICTVGHNVNIYLGVDHGQKFENTAFLGSLGLMKLYKIQSPSCQAPSNLLKCDKYLAKHK